MRVLRLPVTDLINCETPCSPPSPLYGPLYLCLPSWCVCVCVCLCTCVGVVALGVLWPRGPCAVCSISVALPLLLQTGTRGYLSERWGMEITSEELYQHRSRCLTLPRCLNNPATAKLWHVTLLSNVQSVFMWETEMHIGHHLSTLLSKRFIMPSKHIFIFVTLVREKLK